jgi:hypothetical protein
MDAIVDGDLFAGLPSPKTKRRSTSATPTNAISKNSDGRHAAKDGT